MFPSESIRFIFYWTTKKGFLKRQEGVLMSILLDLGSQSPKHSRGEGVEIPCGILSVASLLLNGRLYRYHQGRWYGYHWGNGDPPPYPRPMWQRPYGNPTWWHHTTYCTPPRRMSPTHIMHGTTPLFSLLTVSQGPGFLLAGPP